MSNKPSCFNTLVAATAVISAGLFAPASHGATNYSVCPDWGTIATTISANSSQVSYQATEGEFTWGGTIASINSNNRPQELLEVIIKNISPAPDPNLPYEAQAGNPVCRYRVGNATMLELSITNPTNSLATPLIGNKPKDYAWAVSRDSASTLSCQDRTNQGNIGSGINCPFILTPPAAPAADPITPSATVTANPMEQTQ